MSKMKKCIDCGQQFADTLNACPNCGCPANLCDNVTTQQPGQQQSAQQATTSVNSSNSGVTDPGYLFGRDWSHYIYECAVIGWHAMTSHALDFKGRATRRQWQAGERRHQADARLTAQEGDCDCTCRLVVKARRFLWSWPKS